MRNMKIVMALIIVFIAVTVFCQKRQSSIPVPTKYEKNISSFKVIIENMDKACNNLQYEIIKLNKELEEAKTNVEKLPRGSRSRAVAAENMERVIAEIISKYWHTLTFMESARKDAIKYLKESIVSMENYEEKKINFLSVKMQEVNRTIYSLDVKAAQLAVLLRYASRDLSTNSKDQMALELRMINRNARRAWISHKENINKLMSACSPNNFDRNKALLQSVLDKLEYNFEWIKAKKEIMEILAYIRSQSAKIRSYYILYLEPLALFDSLLINIEGVRLDDIDSFFEDFETIDEIILSDQINVAGAQQPFDKEYEDFLLNSYDFSYSELEDIINRISGKR